MERLRERLHRGPSRWTVPDAPTLFSGDLEAAEVRTVGLNPPSREYTSARGEMLAGEGQRFGTLASLGADDRPRLTDAQCNEALRWMRGDFRPDAPVYGWFAGLERVLTGFGLSFTDGRAEHLDLVQEATAPTWSRLPEPEREALLKQDLPFLEWQIRTTALRSVICNGATVGRHVRGLFRVETSTPGSSGASGDGSAGLEIGGRAFGFAGWNLPLSRPTGLGAAGEIKLRALLGERLLAAPSPAAVPAR